MQTFSHKSNARRNARKMLGGGAKEDIDYYLVATEHGVGWQKIEKTKPKKARPARRAKRKAAPKPAAAAGSSTAEAMLAMLTRPQGATATEVGEAFGWLEHTSRARISTGCRDQNVKIVRTREERKGYDGTVSVYRAEPQLPLAEKREALGNRYERKAAA